MTDPIALVRELDADTITARLEEIVRERQALLVLLRAVGRTKQPSTISPANTPVPPAKRKQVRS